MESPNSTPVEVSIFQKAWKLKVKKLKFSIERHLFIYLLGSNNKIFYSDGIQLSLGR
jgi:hypothetical protein